ncbi:LTA synthase family protein [Bacillus sp. ISL-47]|uniref:LTA synthase family protein n=1 Tax=Bacillus sp. ISL-47 TaxID=2819130 RepID=UPI001BE8C692|nr:LTA synthase family protein [Bacillus sp. ISL-47]MBT2690982.1 LTA synthase family protein [Bacillus sp. ISL-47]MBT2710401.1 LTA synthase family protein [Pseudomonas sp. ISL-84]
MKILLNKRVTNKFAFFFLTAVVFLWLKTYFVQLTQFNLGIENTIQQILLFLNPLGSSLLFLGFAFLFLKRKKYISLILIDLLMSFLLYANVLYYRFFNDFITLPTLTQTQNFGDVSGSIGTLLKPWDVLFFADVILLLVFLSFNFKRLEVRKIATRKVTALLLIALSISGINLAIAEVDRPQLLTRGFDRNYIVKYLGMYNYTIYDAVQSTKATAQRVLADSNDTTEIINFTKSNHAEPNPEYFGAGKGMNVIYVHMESIQNFLIDYELHGEEVTPFLNSLTNEENTLYFDNFFHQTAQGKTADAEFMVANSLYGLPQGSAFTTKGLNTYQAAPAILSQQQEYTSAVFHGNTGSFWNRDEIYKSLGYDKFYDSSYFEMNPDDLADYGLMDKPFFEQSMPYLESLPQPFYANFITVTHHFPFTIDEEEATLGKHTTGNKTVDNYFQTARYADEALEQFFAYLKGTGLYDNSIIIMYGDHYGISNNHNKAMKEVIGKEITPFESAGLQRTPLFIRVPGMDGGVNHEFAGQIDLLPTLLHLLGIDTKEYVHFGTDLLSEQHDDLVPFRNGDFVSPTITSADGKYYDSTTGQLLEEERLEEAKKLQEITEQKLALSDKVVNGDLLRFYTPENFTPVDRSQYNYNQSKEKKNKE